MGPRLIAACAATLLFGASAWGQQEAAVPGDQHVEQAQAQREVSGELLGVRGFVLTVQPRGEEPVQLVVTDEEALQVSRGGEQASLRDLREGEQVRARFEVKGETRIATRVESQP